MNNATAYNRLISHEISPQSIEETVQQISNKIKQSDGNPHYSVEQQLTLLNSLCEFDFGRYVLQNKGINGYWTHYMLTHPWFGRKSGKNNRGEPFTMLEDFLLNHAPSLLATQQRFKIFLQENQKQVSNNASLACVPCGMMGELLYLDYQNISNIDLVGIDYDKNALHDAKSLAEKQQLSHFTQYIQSDAWQLPFENTFDLISSNGLNIYEPDPEKVTALYQKFYKALKPNGKLVTSFLTFLPGTTDQCEWDMSKINLNDMMLQKTLFIDIIGAKFQCFSSSEQTYQQLASIGFKDIQFIYDDARIFPTVIAFKK